MTDEIPEDQLAELDEHGLMADRDTMTPTGEQGPVPEDLLSEWDAEARVAQGAVGTDAQIVDLGEQ
jgi:hypothetical protein